MSCTSCMMHASRCHRRMKLLLVSNPEGYPGDEQIQAVKVSIIEAVDKNEDH